MKYLLSFAMIIALFEVQAQQKPFINHLDKTSATVGETVNISGSGFPAEADLQVNFGAGKANIINASSSLITVTVPATATYGPVTVTNLSSALSGSSSQMFTPSFSGGSFDETALDTQVDFTTNQEYTYDLCACDFNDDGQTDVAIANNRSVILTIFQNNSTLTTPAFSKFEINNGFESVSATCNDLNGDGLSDIVFATEDGVNDGHVYIYRNTGGMTFAKTDFKLPNLSSTENRNPRKVRIADLDSDGKNDLLVGVENDNSIFIYRNTTTSSANITFAEPVQIVISGAANAAALQVGDLTGNGLPDIVSIAFNKTDGIYVYKNESIPGVISFSSAAIINNQLTRTNVALADLNGDSKLDIITTSSSSGNAQVFTNSSSGNSLSFQTTPLTISSLSSAWGIAPADLNGDGKVDISISSAASGGIHVLENTSTTGTTSLITKNIPTTNNNRNIVIFDLNGDAKQDIVTTNQSSETAPGNMTVLVNRNCLVPEIGPTDITFCVGSPFTVSATKTAEAGYTWQVTAGDASVTPDEDEALVTVHSGSSATIEVTITSNDGHCTDIGTQTFSVTNATPPPAPAISSSITGAACFGETVTLTGPGGYDEYQWTLPDGTTFDGSASFSITGASASDAGTYTLRVLESGSCYSEAGAITVAVDEPPLISIQNTGEDAFCESTTITLQVPDYAGFSYQWMKDGSDLAGETANTLEVSTTGSYAAVIISDASGCENISEVYAVSTVSEPVPAFTSVDEICQNIEMSFDASGSTGQSGFDLRYSWDFGDGNTATGVAVSHSYATTETFNVTLTTDYIGVDGCSTQITHTVIVSSPPSLNSIEAGITPGESARLKCPEDSLLLSLPGYVNYTWTVDGNVISTESSAYIKTGDHEDEAIATVDVTTAIGCEVTGASAVVANFENSRIEITADQPIENDTITLEDGVTTVILNATNGSGYVWEPTTILDNSTSESVKAYPRERFTTVSVTGTDAINGCETTASVVIETPGVIPRKSFSPNGDGLGYECWEILNSSNLEGCTVYVIDQRGRQVFKGESPFTENCVWNGNVDNGSTQAPEGIYFFILKCDNSSLDQTGSILLGR